MFRRIRRFSDRAPRLLAAAVLLLGAGQGVGGLLSWCLLGGDAAHVVSAALPCHGGEQGAPALHVAAAPDAGVAQAPQPVPAHAAVVLCTLAAVSPRSGFALAPEPPRPLRTAWAVPWPTVADARAGQSFRLLT